MSGNNDTPRALWIGAVSAIIFLVGYGIALHDFAHQVYQLKGFHNWAEGGYIGFAMMAPVVLGVFIIFLRNTSQIRKAHAARTDVNG